MPSSRATVPGRFPGLLASHSRATSAKVASARRGSSHVPRLRSARSPRFEDFRGFPGAEAALVRGAVDGAESHVVHGPAICHASIDAHFVGLPVRFRWSAGPGQVLCLARAALVDGRTVAPPARRRSTNSSSAATGTRALRPMCTTSISPAPTSSYIAVRPIDSTRAASLIVSSSTSFPRWFACFRCSVDPFVVVPMFGNSALDPLARDKRPENFLSHRCIGDAGHGVGPSAVSVV